MFIANNDKSDKVSSKSGRRGVYSRALKKALTIEEYPRCYLLLPDEKRLCKIYSVLLSGWSFIRLPH
jgi:hypothetical protein